MVARDFVFTSESVNEGHPDKIADQVSDSILDALIKDDPTSRVAVETMCMTGIVIVGGEVTSKTWVDIQETIFSLSDPILQPNQTSGKHRGRELLEVRRDC